MVLTRKQTVKQAEFLRKSALTQNMFFFVESISNFQGICHKLLGW